MIKVPLRRAEKSLYALVQAIEQTGERVVLTRRGRPVAALLHPGAIEALDLLGRMLPDVEDVARSLPDVDPSAPGLGPAPGESP
jgi:antitoxin (DNA-binding transcriptional repressor) of toxin-antitoxin stability system